MGHYAVMMAHVTLEMMIKSYMPQDTCRDIFEDPSNIKILKAQLTEVLPVPTLAAAMQRCYLDLSLSVSDD